MKWILGLLIIAVGIFALQSRVWRSKLDGTYGSAIASLPAQPDAAYAQIASTFHYSNLSTFGKARRVQEKFFRSIGGKLAAQIQGQQGLDAPWVGYVSANLAMLSGARNDPKLPAGFEPILNEQIVSIILAIDEKKADLEQTIGLKDWDALVRHLKEARSDGQVSSELVPGLSDLIAILERVDRKAIALREAITLATQSLADGVRALGLEPASDPSGRLIGKLNKNISSEALTRADRRISAGERACQHYADVFNDGRLPPELVPLWARLLFNHAAMRLAHLIDGGPELRNAISVYMADLYLTPSLDAIPTDAEIYGAFTNVIGDQLGKAAEIFDAANAGAGDAAAQEAAVLEALVYWTQGGFWNTLGNTRHGQETMNRYFKLRGEAALTPGGEAYIQEINSSDYPFVVLR